MFYYIIMNRFALLVMVWVMAKLAHFWCLKTKFAGEDPIKSIDFSPDGQYILTAEHSGRIMLWKSNTLEVLKVYNFGNIAEEAVFSKDQTMIAIGGDDDDVHIINPTTFSLTRTLDTDHGYVTDVDFRYDSNRLLTCGCDKDHAIWNTNSWN